jgi:hypothetical protein
MTYAICEICGAEKYCFPQLSPGGDALIKQAVCPDCLHNIYKNNNLNRI